MSSVNFKEDAERLEAELIAHRRYLHANPELSFHEKNTTAYLAKELEKTGLEPQLFEDYYGLYADISGSRKGKMIVLRADIDALPIQEETNVSFASCVPGVMHACGHDAHAAMLLIAAKILVAHREELNGTVRLLFQAAEESCHGAEYYVNHGVLDDADAIYGSHVWPTLDAPKINVVPGPRMSSCDNFTITVYGKAAHGSAPNYGVDAIVTAATIITQLQTLVSRRSDPRDNLAITVGEIQGGTRFNVIADRVVMKGTARTHSKAVREQIEGWIRNTIEGVALANGAKAELKYDYFPGVLYNDPDLSAIAQEAALELYGEEGLGEHPLIMGSEDFSYYLEKVPGTFALIGIRNQEKGITASNHNPRFDIDEAALTRGAALYAQTAYQFLNRSK